MGFKIIEYFFGVDVFLGFVLILLIGLVFLKVDGGENMNSVGLGVVYFMFKCIMLYIGFCKENKVVGDISLFVVGVKYIF